MIQSIKNKAVEAYQNLSPYLPSKNQLKTAAKVMAITATVIATAIVAIDNYRYEDCVRDIANINKPLMTIPKLISNCCFDSCSALFTDDYKHPLKIRLLHKVLWLLNSYPKLPN